MTWPVVIELAGPPRGKGTARAQPNGPGVYHDPKTRRYEAQLRFAAQQAMGGHPPTAQPVEVEITVAVQIAASWPKKKQQAALLGQVRPTSRPDVDNYAKSCGDALNGIVWLDDSQIVDERIRKIYAQAPSLRITVRPVEPPAALPVTTQQATPICGGDLLAVLA